MSLKDRLRRQLISARQTSEGFLADFETPEQWLKQVHECANHALWFAGHMGHSDNFFISIIDPSLAKSDPRFSAKFGVGSQPTHHPDDYPPIEEVLAYMRERRAVLLKLLDGLSDADLGRATPPETPEFLPDLGSVFEVAVWHEGLHSGQLSVTRRALGFQPRQ
ncbi:MAG: DinB family protein [Pirellulaceae bacterium]